MIKALTFDCWNTLIIDDGSQNTKMQNYLKSVCQENGVALANKDIGAAWRTEDKLREEYVIAHKKTKDARQRTETLCEILDVRLPYPEVLKITEYFDRVALEVRPPRMPGVNEVLKALAPKYRLGLICNGGYHSADTVRQILDAHGLLVFFDWLSFSDELDVAKPHRSIFEITVKKLECELGEAVHIGDSEYSDIVGAKNAGMKAVLFTGVNKKYEDQTTADFVIDKYPDLLYLLERL
ncbi:MAG: HAD family hydrolase [Candidatus Aminicenantes bacterium]|jgi:putative hydrolase of the HAD superfamily